MRRLARRLLIGVSWTAALIAALVIGAEAWKRWEATRERILPAPTGRYAVGRRSFAFHDTTRVDSLSPDTSAKRELFIWVWYPAARPARAQPTPYLPARWLDSLPRGPGLQRLDRVRAHAVDGAPVADATPEYPVLIFSPGLGVMPSSYTTMAEEIASHGYFVVAVSHPYTTGTVIFPDGRMVRAEQRRADFAFSRLAMFLGADLVSVLDYVTREHERGDAFFTRINPHHVGAFGHSFGGTASAEACRLDARFEAGMDMDGTVFGPVVMTGIRQPFFLMMGEPHWLERFRRGPPRFFVDNDQGRIHEEMFLSRTRVSYWLTIPRLNHMYFADEAYFFSLRDRLAERLGIWLGGHRTQVIATSYVRAFFGRYLTGVDDMGSILDHPLDPSLQFIRKPSR